MKFLKFIYFLLSLLLISTSLVAANELNITLVNEKYYSGENIQIELRFLEQPVTPFSPSNVKLKNNGNYIPIGFLYKDLGPLTFVYSQLPLDLEGNFTLIIEKLKFNQNNQLVEKTFLKEFTVEKKPSLKITPYFLQTSKAFTVNVKNNAVEKISAILYLPDFLSTIRNTLELNSAEDRNFFINYINDPKLSNLTIKYNEHEYIVPLYYFTSSIENHTINETVNITTEINETNTSVENKTEGIIFLYHKEIQVSLGNNQSAKGTIVIKNTDKKSYFNIEIFLTGNLNEIMVLDKKSIIEFPKGAEENITLLANDNQNAKEGIYRGYLVIEYLDSQKLFPIEIIIESEQKEIPILLPEENKSYQEELNKSKYSGLFDSKNKNVLNAGIILSVIIVILVVALLYFLGSMKKTTIKVSKLEDKFKRL
ncbi:hypothetical protein J4468_02650 [Candidatus Woesearchaeota archaeon]|nr:hypothetical protein [Candidatus Woesearchaeota archaeon]